MDRYLDKFQSMVARSPLSPDQQQDFISVSLQADDAVLESIVDLCSEDAEWIVKLYENYKAKQSAHADRNTQAWEGILKEEEQLLGDMKK